MGLCFLLGSLKNHQQVLGLSLFRAPPPPKRNPPNSKLGGFTTPPKEKKTKNGWVHTKGSPPPKKISK